MFLNKHITLSGNYKLWLYVTINALVYYIIKIYKNFFNKEVYINCIMSALNDWSNVGKPGIVYVGFDVVQAGFDKYLISG